MVGIFFFYLRPARKSPEGGMRQWGAMPDDYHAKTTGRMPAEEKLPRMDNKRAQARATGGET
eukprot:9316336-Pyramimonas_sp.AAC.1